MMPRRNAQIPVLNVRDIGAGAVGDGADEHAGLGDLTPLQLRPLGLQLTRDRPGGQRVEQIATLLAVGIRLVGREWRGKCAPDDIDTLGAEPIA